MSVLIPDDYGIVRLTWRCTGDNEPMQITLGVFPDLSAEPQDVADDVHSAYRTTAAIASETLPSYTSDPTELTFRRGGDLFEVISGTPLAGTNAASGGPPPPNVAILMRKHSSLGGRANKGRCYLPPYQAIETGIDAAGILAPADVAALTTRWQAFRTALGTAGIVPVILHSSALLTPTAISAFSCDSRVATQRRRLR